MNAQIQFGDVESAIVATFPLGQSVRLRIERYKFILVAAGELEHIERQMPNIGLHLFETNGIFHLPVSQRFAGAHDGQYLPLLVEGGAKHTQRDG